MVVGGAHLLIYPEETLAQAQIDSIVIGDGEDALLELATRLARGQDLEEIPGLWFKKEGKIIRNPPRPVEKNLDRLPFPDRSDLSLTQHRFAADRLSPAAIMITARGCPFSCTFCCTVDRIHRKRSPQNIVDEMLVCREMGYQWIDFWDDVFNITKPAILDLCDEIIRRKVNLPWSCRGRVAPFDEEMAAKMAEAGCERVNLGVESASQEILDRTKKGITPEQCRRAFALAKKHHISTVGFFMIGFPGETREQALQTIRFMMELDPDFASFLSLFPLPGSEIYQQAIKDPTFLGDYAREYAKSPTPGFIWRSWTTTLSEAEKDRLLRRANLGFYFRPRYLWRSFQRLSSLEDFYAKAKMALIILTA